MKTLHEIKANYMLKPTAKLPYVVDMYEIHQHLFDYAEMLKDTDISEVRITDNQVYMTFRASGIKMLLMKGDTSLPPLTAFNFGSYEQEELDMAFEIIEKSLKPGFTALDIGANVGWFSLHAARRFKDISVYAFEPIPHAFKCLTGNLKLNDLEGRIKAFNMGLSNESTTAEFYCDPIRCGASSLTNITEIDTFKKIPCEIRRLDDFVKERDIAVDFIKCDVEGAELFVVKGGVETIKKHKPAILMEMLRKWASKFNYHPNDIIDLLKGLGYKCHKISGHQLLPFDRMDESTAETNFIFIHQDKLGK